MRFTGGGRMTRSSVVAFQSNTYAMETNNMSSPHDTPHPTCPSINVKVLHRKLMWSIPQNYFVHPSTKHTQSHIDISLPSVLDFLGIAIEKKKSNRKA